MDLQRIQLSLNQKLSHTEPESSVRFNNFTFTSVPVSVVYQIEVTDVIWILSKLKMIVLILVYL